MAPDGDRLAIGRLALKAGALREALLHFRAAVATSPDSVDAHRAHAETAALLGEFDEALAARRCVVALDASLRNRWELGILADCAGARPLAVETLESCLDRDWSDGELGAKDPREYLFRMHLEAGDVDAALRLAERLGWLRDRVDYCAAPLAGVTEETQGLLAVLRHPRSAPCAPALALGFADTGNVNLARFVARTTATSADDPAAREAAARLLRRRLPNHDVPALAESLNAAAFNLHHVYGHSGEAIRVYHRAIAVDPMFSWLYRNLGVVYLDLHEYADAVTWIDKSLAIDPEHTRAWAGLAMAAYDQERFEEALTAYRRAAELDPSVADFHSGVGTCLIRLGRRREALDPLRAASQIDPADAVRRRFYEYHAEVEALEQA
jgi:tetratricopeptide (TPR) repeat protein